MYNKRYIDNDINNSMFIAFSFELTIIRPTEISNYEDDELLGCSTNSYPLK